MLAEPCDLNILPKNTTIAVKILEKLMPNEPGQDFPNLIDYSGNNPKQVSQEAISLQLHNFKNDPDQKLIDLETKLASDKIFMNMVVHDIRNPASSIDFGINQALGILEDFEAQYH